MIASPNVSAAKGAQPDGGPASSLHNDRIKNRLWWLHFDADHLSDRMRASLDQIDDPALAAARDLILQGKTAVRQVADPFLAATLDDIFTNHRPPARMVELHAKRRQDLAGDLWPGLEAIMAANVLEPGRGEWPKRPRHTCKNDGANGAVITIRMHKTTVTPMVTPKWRDDERRPGCRACYYERVKRQCRQILFELTRLNGRLTWGELATKHEYRKFTARVRKQRQRNDIDGAYRAYPQDDGRFVIVCESQLLAGGAAVPNDKTELFELVKNWARTPDDRRISSSAGWGGNWQGIEGDGRVKQAERAGVDLGPSVQLWTGASVSDVAAALGVDLNDWQDKFSVQMEPTAVYQSISQFELFERKTNRAGLDAFIEFISGDVTDKPQGKTDKTLSLMRDIDEPPADDPLPGWATKPIFLSVPGD